MANQRLASICQSTRGLREFQTSSKKASSKVSSTTFVILLDEPSKTKALKRKKCALFTRGNLVVKLMSLWLLASCCCCCFFTHVYGIAPSIDYSHNMRILKLPKWTQVGELVYRLRGSDGDASGHLQFGVTGIEARSLLDVVPVSRAQWNEADVYLRSPLLDKQYNVSLYVTDGNKTTQVESTIIVTNDEDAHQHQDFDAPFSSDSTPVGSSEQQSPLNGSSANSFTLLDSSTSTGNSSGRWTNNYHPRQHQQPLLSPFIRPRHVYNVPEDTKPGESIASLNVLESEKSDLPVRFELRGQGADKFQIKYVFGPRGQSRGELLLVQPLDYEKQNLFSLKVLALNAWTNLQYDTRNVATLDIVITVGDVQDSPPVFRRLPHSLRLTNTMQPGDLVGKVEAEDGDFADQRPISYALDASSPLASYFDIDKHSGEIKLKRSIRELTSASHGVAAAVAFADDNWSKLVVYAQEVPDTTSYDHLWPPMYTRAELGLQLVDVVNEAPRFVGGWQTSEPLGQRTLHGYLRPFVDQANSNWLQSGHQLNELHTHYDPVQWYTNNTIKFQQQPQQQQQQQQGTANEMSHLMMNGRPLALDFGLGPNGTFELYLEGRDAHLLELEPKFAVTRQTSFNLFAGRDALKSRLTGANGDDSKLLELFLVARDFGSPQRMSSRVKLSIELLDDGSAERAPQFEQEIYLFPVYENAQLGQIVGNIKARLSSEMSQSTTTNSKVQRVRFASLTGLDSQLFRLDPESGLVTLEGQLDREKQSHYLLLAEARDQISGHSNYSKIIVNVMDVNDNAPIFSQQHYEAVLLADGSFHQPLVVSAQDIDEPGSVNSQVAYEIIAGNQNDQFMIDSLSGVIYANPNKQTTNGISLGNLPAILTEPIVPFTTLAPPPQAGKIRPSSHLGGSSSYTTSTQQVTTASSHEVEEEEETTGPSGRPSTIPQSIPMRLKNWLGFSSPDATAATTTSTMSPEKGRHLNQEEGEDALTTSPPPPATTNPSTTRSGRLLLQSEQNRPELEMLINMEANAANRYASPGGPAEARNLLSGHTSPFNPMKLPPVTSLIVRAHDFGIPLRSSTCKVNIYNQAVQSRQVSLILNGTSEQLEQRRDAIERAFGSLTGSRATIESLDALSESSSLCVARTRLAMPQSSIVDLTDLSSLMNAIDYKLPAYQVDQQHQQQQQFRHPTGATITHYIAAGDRLYPAGTIPQQQQQFHSASSNITSTTVNGGLLHPNLYTDINSIALDSNNALERRLLIYIIIVGVCILALLVIWMIYSCSREDQVKLIDKSSLEDGHHHHHHHHQRYRHSGQQEPTEVKKTTTKSDKSSKQDDVNKTYAKTTTTTGSNNNLQQGQLAGYNSAIANNLAKQHQAASNDTSPPSQQPMNLSRPEQYSMYNGQVWFGPVPVVPSIGFPGGATSLTTGRHHTSQQMLAGTERRASSAPSGNSLDSALHQTIGGRNSALHRTTPRPANGQFFPNTVGYMENLAAISNGPMSPGSSQSNLLARRQRRRKVAPLNDAEHQQTVTDKRRSIDEGHTNEAFEMDESGNLTATSGEQGQPKASKQTKRTSKASRTTTTTRKSHSRLGSATLSESSTCSSATRTLENDESVFLDSDQELLGFDSTGTPIIATHTRRASVGQQQPQVAPSKTVAAAGLHQEDSKGDQQQAGSKGTDKVQADGEQIKTTKEEEPQKEQRDKSNEQQDEQSETKITERIIDSKHEEQQGGQINAKVKEKEAKTATGSQSSEVTNGKNMGNISSGGASLRQQQAAGDLMGELNERLVRRQKTLRRQSADKETFEGPNEEPPGKQTTLSTDATRLKLDDHQPEKKEADTTSMQQQQQQQQQPRRLTSQDSSFSLQSDQMKLPQVVGLSNMKNSDLLEKQSIFAMTYSGIATDKLPS